MNIVKSHHTIITSIESAYVCACIVRSIAQTENKVANIRPSHKPSISRMPSRITQRLWSLQCSAIGRSRPPGSSQQRKLHTLHHTNTNPTTNTIYECKSYSTLYWFHWCLLITIHQHPDTIVLLFFIVLISLFAILVSSSSLDTIASPGTRCASVHNRNTNKETYNGQRLMQERHTSWSPIPCSRGRTSPLQTSSRLWESANCQATLLVWPD